MNSGDEDAFYDLGEDGPSHGASRRGSAAAALQRSNGYGVQSGQVADGADDLGDDAFVEVASTSSSDSPKTLDEGGELNAGIEALDISDEPDKIIKQSDSIPAIEPVTTLSAVESEEADAEIGDGPDDGDDYEAIALADTENLALSDSGMPDCDGDSLEKQIPENQIDSLSDASILKRTVHVSKELADADSIKDDAAYTNSDTPKNNRSPDSTLPDRDSAKSENVGNLESLQKALPGECDIHLDQQPSSVCIGGIKSTDGYEVNSKTCKEDTQAATTNPADEDVCEVTQDETGAAQPSNTQQESLSDGDFDDFVAATVTSHYEAMSTDELRLEVAKAVHAHVAAECPDVLELFAGSGPEALLECVLRTPKCRVSPEDAMAQLMDGAAAVLAQHPRQRRHLSLM